MITQRDLARTERNVFRDRLAALASQVDSYRHLSTHTPSCICATCETLRQTLSAAKATLNQIPR